MRGFATDEVSEGCCNESRSNSLRSWGKIMLIVDVKMTKARQIYMTSLLA